MNANPGTQIVDAAEPLRKHFTIDEANKALTYVARVTDDIRTSYRRAVSLQEKLEQPASETEGEAIRVDYEATIDRLNRYVEELNEVGVELKDYEIGLVDFPAVHEGREILLCWKSGEERIEAWHELNAGFAGRRSLQTLDKPVAAKRKSDA